MRATFRDSQVLCRILACQINLETGLSIDGLAGEGPRQETLEWLWVEHPPVALYFPARERMKHARPKEFVILCI